MGSFGVWHWFIVAVLVLLVWKALRPTPGGARKERAMASSRPLGVMADVVGESYHTAGFRRLKKRLQADEDAEQVVEATLRLDEGNAHDDQAVAVFVGGEKLGNLSRHNARAYRAELRRRHGATTADRQVPAQIYWGGEDEIYSISVDLGAI